MKVLHDVLMSQMIMCTDTESSLYEMLRGEGICVLLNKRMLFQTVDSQ